MNTSCQEIKTFDELLTYRDAWRVLHARCAQPNVFASFEWLWNWWRQFGAVGDSEDQPFREPLLLITVSDDRGKPMGMIPMYFSHSRRSAIEVKVLRMVGYLPDANENPTEEPIVLLERGRERMIVRAIGAYLQHMRGSSDWDYAKLTFPCLSEAAGPRRATPHSMMRRKIDTTEELILPDNWDTFRRSLHKSMRDNLSYYPRLITRRGHHWAVRVAKQPEDIRAATDILIDLHRRRAAGARGVTHANHLPFRAHQDFQRDCLSDLAAQGMASVYLLEIDGVAVAAQSVLHTPDGICFYYSGFDTAWYDFSPLTILAAEIFKDAIDAGERRVNLLAHPKPWKTRWGARSVDRFERVACLRANPVHLLRCAAHGINRTAVRQTGKAVGVTLEAVLNLREANRERRIAV